MRQRLKVCATPSKAEVSVINNKKVHCFRKEGGGVSCNNCGNMIYYYDILYVIIILRKKELPAAENAPETGISKAARLNFRKIKNIT